MYRVWFCFLVLCFVLVLLYYYTLLLSYLILYSPLPFPFSSPPLLYNPDLIQSIRVGSSISLFIFHKNLTPHVLSDGNVEWCSFISIQLCVRVLGLSIWRLTWCSVLVCVSCWFDVWCYMLYIIILLLYYYILLYIIHILLYLIYYIPLPFLLFLPPSSTLLLFYPSPSIFLFFYSSSSSLLSSNPSTLPPPNIPHSKYTCRHLDILIYVRSHPNPIFQSHQQFDPACFIGVDGWGVW